MLYQEMMMSQNDKVYRTLVKALLGREMLSGTTITCPHCGTVSILTDEAWANFGMKGSSPQIDGQTVQTIGGARCAACSGLVATATVSDKSGNVHTNILLWPRDIRPDRAPADLDADIKKAYDESREVLSLSPQAAAVLSRRCLQHVIRNKLSIKCKTLFNEIDKAKASDKLSSTTRSALDHVRELGNWGAHPERDQADFIIEVSPEEAAYTIDVLELLFNDLYVQPSKVDAMHRSIGKRKGE